jgi:hypothetical protein
LITFSARLGSFRATVTGLRNLGNASMGLVEYRSPVVTVIDSAGTFSERLTGVYIDRSPTFPRAVGPQPFDSPLCLVRFAGSTRPVVLLGAGGSAGTHASNYADVIAVAINRNGLSKAVSDISQTGGQPGDGSQQVVFDDGRPLLVGPNGAFEYAGTATAQPLIVLSMRDGRFINVTRTHPSFVAGTAATFWAGWRYDSRDKMDARDFGIFSLAAWAAVTCVVGKLGHVKAVFARLERGHWITASFVRTTEKQLIALGYCAS